MVLSIAYLILVSPDFRTFFMRASPLYLTLTSTLASILLCVLASKKLEIKNF